MFSDELPLPERRWYDNIGQMTMALHLSRQLPLEIRQVVAHHLNQAIDSHRKNHRTDRHTTSLGPQRALTLYKAENRLRWYDEEPSLHRALTMMIGLPHHYLEEFASRLLDASQYWNAQQQYGTYYGEYLMNDAIESILRADQMALNHDENGFRLVMGTPPLDPGSEASATPLRPHRHRNR